MTPFLVKNNGKKTPEDLQEWVECPTQFSFNIKDVIVLVEPEDKYDYDSRI